MARVLANVATPVYVLTPCAHSGDDRQPMTSQIPTKRRLAVLFSLPICFSLVFFAATTATEYMAAKFLKIENLLISLDALRALAGDVDTSERGFLLTSDPQYLNPLRQATATMPEVMQEAVEGAKDERKDVRDRVSQVRFFGANTRRPGGAHSES